MYPKQNGFMKNGTKTNCEPNIKPLAGGIYDDVQATIHFDLIGKGKNAMPTKGHIEFRDNDGKLMAIASLSERAPEYANRMISAFNSIVNGENSELYYSKLNGKSATVSMKLTEPELSDPFISASGKLIRRMQNKVTLIGTKDGLRKKLEYLESDEYSAYKKADESVRNWCSEKDIEMGPQISAEDRELLNELLKESYMRF